MKGAARFRHVTHPGFPYMTWAKAHYFGTEFNLIASSIPPPSPEELSLPDGLDPNLEILTEGPDSLQEDLAEAYASSMDQILILPGSTQANLLAFASYLSPGDEVLIEAPAYGLFEGLATMFGLGVRRVERREQDAWQLLPERVAEALGPKTRLFAFTSLHNPTGALASEELLWELGELLAERGCIGLASEVYLDFVEGTGKLTDGEAARRRFAAEIHPQFVSVNSFTKVYGLGSLRLGWLQGSRERIAEAYPIRECICPVLPALPATLASEALRRRTALLERARRRSAAGLEELSNFLSREEGFSACVPSAGLVTAVRVQGVEDSRAFAAFARESEDLGVVPGYYFGLEGYLRIGVGEGQVAVREGLERLARARRRFLENSA